MHSKTSKDLARVGAETVAHVAATTASCKNTADHIRHSKESIERSLDLLSSTLHQVDPPEVSADYDAHEDRSAA
jgi:hypothetical protein